MNTSDIITELKSLGLDPAKPSPEALDSDRILSLMNELGARSADPEAAAYLLAMNAAINQMDHYGHLRNQED